LGLLGLVAARTAHRGAVAAILDRSYLNRFNLLQACFYLLAVVIFIAMIETMFTIASCMWMITVQQRAIDACGNVGQNVRELITEAITGILALLVAQRSGPHEPKN
jgi:hypothetical protein